MLTLEAPKSRRQNLHLQTVKRVNSVDLDEVAHDEPPHQDLHCLQSQLFSSLALEVLNIQLCMLS